MRCRLKLALVLLGACIAGGRATSRAGDPPRDPAQNAALQYWQAFTSIPQHASGTQWEVAYKHPLTASTEDAAFLFERAGISASRALRHLRHGASRPYCEWGLPMREDGPNTLLHHTQRSSTASGVLLLSARLEQSRGNWDAAIDDLMAAWVFYRHIAHDRTLISWANAGFGKVESVVAPLAAYWLPQLDEPTLRRLEQKLEDLPPAPPFGDVIDGMGDLYLDWMVYTLDHDGLERVREQLLAAAQGDGDEVEAAIIKATASPESVLDFVQSTRGHFDAAAAIAALPLDEFEDAMSDFYRDGRTDDALADWLLNPFGERCLELRVFEMKSAARLAMFKAACALQRGGVEGLKLVEDPFGSGPFSYSPADGGFTLTSGLKVRGEPYSIRFGTGAIPEPDQESHLLIYDTQADMAAVIAEAQEAAQRENKRILLQWGFNGCIPCYQLHAMLKRDANLVQTIDDSYVFIPMDVTNERNRELAKTYEVELPGVPHLTVLDASGTVLANAKAAGNFYAHGELDAQLVQEFLDRWASSSMVEKD